MLFNSIEFLVFFPAVTALYFVLPHRLRWALLLAASCLFYMAFIPSYILILLVTIIVDYFAGIWIEGSSGRRRKSILILSLITNCGFLAFFKYFNFLNENLAYLSHALGWRHGIPSLDIILPIGLSFHTFQAMSYTIEVYRGNQPAERHFGIYALYVLFYPQLVAGPIERPQRLLPQFRVPHVFDYERVSSGLKLMAWGMLKKVLIADRLAHAVDVVYNDPSSHHGLAFAVATVLFAFQIYCDFSGYSDIALGSAQVMGIRLMENFRRPYFARSIEEFWRRWHISLSTWFRDYLYIPLGGNRVSIPRWYANLFVVFVVSGLWHGANWTFVVWGALHGAYLVVNQVVRRRFGTRDSTSAVGTCVRILGVFVIVCVAWVFFRAKTIGDAWLILSRGLLGIGETLQAIPAGAAALKQAIGLRGLFPTHTDWIIALAGLALLVSVEYVQERFGSIRNLLSTKPAAVRWLVYEAVLLIIIFLGDFSQKQFIYFQF
jgi:alginate O-acetyltransferase complex protein AlgI